MNIIAGIDIKNGKIVQLKGQGEKVISNDPIAFCKALKLRGVQKLQIVDIDGVFSGQTKMLDLLADLQKHVGLPIQFGGGIRTFETAQEILSLGIDEIVIGTSAVDNQDLLIALLDQYPQQIIVAADVYKGLVYTEGWEANSSTSIEEFLHTLQLIHVPHVLITDISKDGTLSGVDADLIEPLMVYDQIKISLSGGIHSDEDIIKLKALNLHSVVVTTAIIEGLITI